MAGRAQPDPCRGVYCGDHGSCSGGTCTCQGEYRGNRCQNDPCDTSDDCSTQHGTCVVSGDSHTCRCDGEWGGTTCQNDPCDTSDDCSTQHGTCRVSGTSHTCRCDGEWGGTTCQRDPCDTSDDCSRHGTCVVSGDSHTCRCNGEWGGTTCQNDPCDTSDDCSRHGTCAVSGDSHTCGCDDGYSGTTCATPASCSATSPTTHAASCTAGYFGANPDSPSQCPVTCDPGYPSSDTPATPATCGPNGRWQGGSTCEAVSCGKITQDASTGCEGRYSYADGRLACTSTCDTGFTITGAVGGGPSNNNKKFYCGTDGRFTQGSADGAPLAQAQMTCLRECCAAAILP
jgi:hypothetical protein